MRAKGLNIKGGFPGSEGLCKVSGHTVIETSTWWYYVVWGGGEEALGMEMIQMGERAGGWWETEYRQEKIHRSEFTNIPPPPPFTSIRKEPVLDQEQTHTPGQR